MLSADAVWKDFWGLTALAAAFTHTPSLSSKPTAAAGNLSAKLKVLLLHNWKGALVPAAMWPEPQPCPCPSLHSHIAQALKAARVGAGSWPGGCEISEEGRSERVRLWRGWRTAWAHSPCDEPRRDVKSGGHHSEGPFASHSLAPCCIRGEEELGDVWVGLALAEWYALAVHLPCRACVLDPCAHPNGFAPGSASALHCPILFHCSFPHPYTHPKIV